jgi:hypothetical protein
MILPFVRTILRYDRAMRGLLAGAGVIALLVCGFAPQAASALSLTSDPFVQQGEKLVDTELSEHAELGISVAISADGNTALVGAAGYKGFAGAAWVFTRSGSTWTEQAKLDD